MNAALAQTATITPPAWFNRSEYPFTLRSLSLADGSIHYVDEGSRDAPETLVFVHGTPVWSFLYRHCIKRLLRQYRCVAIDHLGFGLSEKPYNADYTPQAHARRLKETIDSLGLTNISLVAQDYGGPIALDYAVHNAQDVSRIALSNTWMWSLPRMEQGGRLFDNPLGKWLYLNYGFSPKVLIPQSFGDKRNLSSEVHAHYLAPLDAPHSRLATFALVKALKSSKDWYDSLWEKRETIAHKPVAMIWGMQDTFVPAAQLLPLWKQVWTNARFIEIVGAGHFVEEERSETFGEAVAQFLAET